MDLIRLENMRVFGRHGANPGERDEPQAFDLSVICEADLSDASRSDDIAQAIDYDKLHRRIASTVADTSFALLERLAAEILDTIFADARIARAEVTISKPGVLGGATPGVTLLRENSASVR